MRLDVVLRCSGLLWQLDSLKPGPAATVNLVMPDGMTRLLAIDHQTTASGSSILSFRKGYSFRAMGEFTATLDHHHLFTSALHYPETIQSPDASALLIHFQPQSACRLYRRDLDRCALGLMDRQFVDIERDAPIAFDFESLEGSLRDTGPLETEIRANKEFPMPLFVASQIVIYARINNNDIFTRADSLDVRVKSELDDGSHQFVEARVSWVIDHDPLAGPMVVFTTHHLHCMVNGEVLLAEETEEQHEAFEPSGIETLQCWSIDQGVFVITDALYALIDQYQLQLNDGTYVHLKDAPLSSMGVTADGVHYEPRPTLVNVFRGMPRDLVLFGSTDDVSVQVNAEVTRHLWPWLDHALRFNATQRLFRLKEVQYQETMDIMVRWLFQDRTVDGLWEVNLPVMLDIYIAAVMHAIPSLAFEVMATLSHRGIRLIRRSSLKELLDGWSRVMPYEQMNSFLEPLVRVRCCETNTDDLMDVLQTMPSTGEFIRPILIRRMSLGRLTLLQMVDVYAISPHDAHLRQSILRHLTIRALPEHYKRQDVCVAMRKAAQWQFPDLVEAMVQVMRRSLNDLMEDMSLTSQTTLMLRACTLMDAEQQQQQE